MNQNDSSGEIPIRRSSISSPRGQRRKAFRLLRTAERRVNQHKYLEALTLRNEALGLCPADEEVGAIARDLSNYLAPGYHLPMMNDSHRNAIWDQALRKVIQPGMRVLEIGTGAGMLAMMAARAGATVVTCEFHEVVAEIAREVVERNGLSDRITVLTKSSLDLKLGVDLDERADLLFCDNFADDFFSFDPLRSIADARHRLLKPDAVCLPMTGSVHLALGDWSRYGSFFQATEACGFDITPAAVFAPGSKTLEIDDIGVTLLSNSSQAFLFDLQDSTFLRKAEVRLQLEASQNCTVTGIVQWIQLQLGADLFVDSKPNPGVRFFSSPRFCPLVRPYPLGASESLRVVAKYNGHRLSVWLEGERDKNLDSQNDKNSR
jgi:SAM-dependent methyltransferase